MSGILVARLVSMLAAFVQLPLLTRELGPAGYALVAAAIASGTYVSLLAAEPTTLAFQRFAGSPTEMVSYAAARRTLTKVAPVVTVVVLSLGALTGYFWVCFAAVGWGLSLAVSRFVSTAWLMWDLPWRYSVNLMASTATRTIVLCTLVVAGVRPDVSVAVAGLASCVVALVLGPRVGGVVGRDTPWTFRFGLALAVSSTAVTVLQVADKIVVPFLLRPAEAGRYAAMANLATLSLGAVLGVLATALYPGVVRAWEGGMHRRAASLQSNAMALVLLVTGACAAAVLVVGESLGDLVLGPGFVDGQVLAALVFGVGLLSLGQYGSWSFQLRLETTTMQVRAWVAAAVGVGALVLGTAVLGIDGAGLAAVAGGGAYAFLMHLVVRGPTTRLGLTATAALTFGGMVVLLAERGLALAVALTVCAAAVPLVLSTRKNSADQGRAEVAA